MSATNDTRSASPNHANNINHTAPWSHLPPPPPTAPTVLPTGAPPRYTRYMARYAMRWPLIFSAAVGFIWAVAMGVYSFRDMASSGETSKEKVFDLIIGIMYFVVAAVEAFCIVVAVVQKPKFAKSLKIAAPVGVGVAVVAQIIAVVAHFTCKSALIDRCVTNTTGATEFDRFGNSNTVDETEARDLCGDSFDRATWGVFAWLVVVSLLAIFFAGIAMSYLHQLLSPPAPMNQSIPLQNYPPPPHQSQAQQGYWGPPPSQQQNWMVPPYPGPPAAGQEPYEKSDFQPNAEWAQAGYAPPAGPPPGASRSTNVDHGEHREEEEAWERARNEGVTAHLTGHGPGPRRDSGEADGYAMRNTEEDEAWERARGEGVTAHLTGHNKPRRDGDVV